MEWWQSVLMGHAQIWGEAIKTTCISGPSHLQEREWDTPSQDPGGLRMKNMDPANLWLYQGLRGRRVSGGKTGGQWSGGEKEETLRWKDWWQRNGRPAKQGDAVPQWVGSDRHVSHRPPAPWIAPGWPLWLTASRWRMNRVVRTTVSQSQIATATRPWLNRHSCSRWSPGAHADFWHRGVRRLRLCQNYQKWQDDDGHHDTPVGRSGASTQFSSIY